MLKYASTMVAAVTLGMVTAFAQPVNAQTTEKPLVLKGQSTHPASSNFHLIFKLWAETVEKMTAGRLKIETLPAGAIVPPFEVFDATSKNVLDVGMATVRLHPRPQHRDDTDVARSAVRHGRLGLLGLVL